MTAVDTHTSPGGEREPLPVVPAAAPAWEGVGWTKRQVWRSEGILSRHRDAFVIVGLMAIGLALRLWIHRGLWLDEATTVSQTSMDFTRMLSYLRTSDAHPPLFHMLMWADLRIFGTSEWAVRTPPMALGTLLIPLVYGAAREIFGRRTGLIAALLMTVSPAAIWYSQEARMYALFMGLATVALWAQVRCVRGGSKKAWVVYSVASAAVIWSHYFASFFVLTQQIGFLILMWTQRGTPEGKRLFAGWIRSAIGIAMLLAPLMVMTYGQLDGQAGVADANQANGTASVGSPIYTVFSSLASSVVGYHSDSMMRNLNALWPVGMLLALLALGRGRSRSTAMLVALIFLPLTILFVLSFKRIDVLELRYFAGAIPVLMILLARGVTLVAKKRATAVVLTTLLVASMGVGLIDEQRAGANPRVYDFNATLTDLNNDQRPGDLLLFEPFYLDPTVNYYAPRYESYPLLAGLSSTTTPGRIIIVDSLSFSDRQISAERVKLVTDRLKQDRTLVSHVQRKHIEVWVFE